MLICNSRIQTSSCTRPHISMRLRLNSCSITLKWNLNIELIRPSTLFENCQSTQNLLAKTKMLSAAWRGWCCHIICISNSLKIWNKRNKRREVKENLSLVKSCFLRGQISIGYRGRLYSVFTTYWSRHCMKIIRYFIWIPLRKLYKREETQTRMHPS